MEEWQYVRKGEGEGVRAAREVRTEEGGLGGKREGVGSGLVGGGRDRSKRAGGLGGGEQEGLGS